ncbi:MAG: hypothetical protein ACXVCV_25250 [Polyangia bacterium]
MGLILLVALAGCAGRRGRDIDPGFNAGHVDFGDGGAPRPSVVHGSRADLTTRAGAADGYVVDDRCRWPNCFAVRGSGERWFDGTAPHAGADDWPALERWRHAVLAAIARRSAHTSGFGGACHDGGLFVTLDDWRDADGAIARVGALVARERLRNEVALCVEAQAHPVEEVAR